MRAKKEKRGIFRFMEPAEADALIRSQGKKWKPEALMIRRQIIVDLIGQGLSKRRVIEEITSRWEITLSTAYGYYNEAVEGIKEDFREEVASLRELQVSRLQAIAEDAIAHGDRKSALGAYKQIAEINGLNVTKIEADVKGDTTVSFDFGY